MSYEKQARIGQAINMTNALFIENGLVPEENKDLFIKTVQKNLKLIETIQEKLK